jgi:hypothetical protein
MARRWPDDTGAGTDAPAGSGDAAASFQAELAAPGWLAEDPEAHLGPKLRAWLPAHPEWSLTGTRTLDDGSWEIQVGLAGAPRARDRRAAALALVGSFAEDRCFVEEVRETGPTFVIVTGQPARDGFRAHGHVVRLVLGPRGETGEAGEADG